MRRLVTSLLSHLGMRFSALRRGLASPAMRRVQAASLAHNCVEYAVIVALTVWAFDRGGAPAVGVVTVIRTVPALMYGPLLSVLADRRSRPAVLTGGFAARTATTLALATAVGAESPVAATYLFAALDAVVASMFYPTYGALVPELAASPSELATANAMASATENLGTILGPALAAGVLLITGPAAVFIGAAAVVAVAAALAATLRTDRKPAAQQGNAESFLRQFGRGVTAVRRNPGSAAVIGSWAFESVLVGVSEVLIVVVAFELIGWGESGVGWLNAVLGAGGLAGGIAMTSLAGHRPFGRYLAIGVALFGVGLAASSLPLVPIVLIAHVTVGIAAAQVDVAAMTLLQRTVPEHELGRVLGLFEGAYWGALGIGAALGSWMVVLMGLQPALVITGVAGALVGLGVLPRLHGVDGFVEVPETRLALLRRVPTFAALPVPTLERLARRVDEQAIPAGGEVIRKGAADDTIYVVASGELEVRDDGRLVATVGTADVVGEIAALRHVKRTATVTATSPAVLLSLDAAVFVQAVSGHGVAAAAVDTLVDRRIGQLRRLRGRTGR